MNPAAVVISAVFAVLGTGVFLFFLFGKSELSSSRAKNYYRASAGVYLSALILFLVLSLTLQGLPTEFIVIAEIMVTIVFGFSTYLLYRIVMQLESIQKDIDDGKVRSSEQVAREEEAFEQRFKDKEESEDPEDDN